MYEPAPNRKENTLVKQKAKGIFLKRDLHSSQITVFQNPARQAIEQKITLAPAALLRMFSIRDF
jgi:hypothetical protein